MKKLGFLAVPMVLGLLLGAQLSADISDSATLQASETMQGAETSFCAHADPMPEVSTAFIYCRYDECVEECEAYGQGGFAFPSPYAPGGYDCFCCA